MLDDIVKYETKFQYYILKKGLSYRILSSLTNIPKSSLYNYAIGRRIPDFKTAFKIIKILGLEPSELERLFDPYYGPKIEQKVYAL